MNLDRFPAWVAGFIITLVSPRIKELGIVFTHVADCGWTASFPAIKESRESSPQPACVLTRAAEG